jgi:hypothetical protein
LQISEDKDLEKKINLKTNINMKTRKSIYHRTFAFAYVLLVAVIFSGCGEQSQTKKRKCYLVVRNGSGWTSGSSFIECDSFQMQGTRKAFAWVDGYKMNVESEDVIYPNVR